MNPSSLLAEFDRLSSPRVLVLGDLILDRYTRGDAERLSQEAPIPVLRVSERDERLGGAANVCNMLRGLEAEVSCCGVIGGDSAGKALIELLAGSGVEHDLVATEPARPTTVKERFIGRISGLRPGQLLRVDHESHEPLMDATVEHAIRGITEQLHRFDVLLISDYGKGVCTPHLVEATITAARRAGIPVLVDPQRGAEYHRYAGATLLKPNRVETELAVGAKITCREEAFQAGRSLCEMCSVDMALMTLDRDGLALVHRDGKAQLFPTRARSVYDITGAGDMVLATLGACFGGGLSAEVAAQLANVAAGLEVERPGVAVIRNSEIRSELGAGGGRRAVLSLEQATSAANTYRDEGRRIVFTNGCFDLLHVGHVTYLAEAAKLGDVLIVGVNSDDCVKRLKGPERPVIGEGDRAAIVAALACVDHVIVFEDDTPHRLLHAIRPDVLVKGGTYSVEGVVGKEVVEAYGGQVCVTSITEGISTTQIIEDSQHESGDSDRHAA